MWPLVTGQGFSQFVCNNIRKTVVKCVEKGMETATSNLFLNGMQSPLVVFYIAEIHNVEYTFAL